MTNWETAIKPEPITDNIFGMVSRTDDPRFGVYVTLQFPSYSMTMHAGLARHLRDWLVANVPDGDA